MHHFFVLFLMMCFGHCLADYPLQGEFLAKGKNFKNPIPGYPWYTLMAVHCFLHAGFVYLITGSLPLALAEFVVHFWIDCRKCDNSISFNYDQFLHIGYKFVWAYFACS